MIPYRQKEGRTQGIKELKKIQHGELEAYANSCSSSVFDEIRDECTKKINLIGSAERRRPKLQLCDFTQNDYFRGFYASKSVELGVLSTLVIFFLFWGARAL